MPRAPRHLVVVPGFPHHVILRGNNRRRLFSYDGCYLSFLGLLRAASRRHGIAVHALALMTNHVHLVVTPRDVGALARFVQSAAQRWALRRNTRRHATGKLFEQRYLALPIADVAYLAATLAYVDLNPLRAGLVREAASYRWSTCALHTGRDAQAAVRAVWSPHDWYLELAGDDALRGARYREWLASRSAGELDALADIAHDHEDAGRPRLRAPRRPDRSLAI